MAKKFRPIDDFEQIHRPVSGDTVAVIETEYGDVKIRLFPEQCPVTCENFIGLAQRHFYDGLTFHRVIKNFMIQGGDPEGNGTGGHSLWGGSIEDEFERNLYNFRGALAMANTGLPNTGGSQFFIVQNSNCGSSVETLEDKGWPHWAAETYGRIGGCPSLDGGFQKITKYLGHTVFGQVYKGMDAVNAIAELETDDDDHPLKPILIKKVWCATVK